MSTSDPHLFNIASYIVKDISEFLFPGHNKPLAWAKRFDGSLSVVAANGQKFIFTPEEVAAAEKALSSRPPSPVSRPSKPSRKPRAPKKSGA